MLQSSGQISLDDIRIELGVPIELSFNLDDAVNGIYEAVNTCSASYPSTTPPYSLTDWYSYNHSASCITLINVINTSTDTNLNSITVNAVSVTYVSGNTLPISAGQSGVYSTTQFGSYNISVGYSINAGTQKINITDSAPNTQCFNLLDIGGTAIKAGSTVTQGVTMTITAANGSC